MQHYTEKNVKKVWGVTGTKRSGDGSNAFSSPDRARWRPLCFDIDDGFICFLPDALSSSLNIVHYIRYTHHLK